MPVVHVSINVKNRLKAAAAISGKGVGEYADKVLREHLEGIDLPDVEPTNEQNKSLNVQCSD